MPLSEEERGKQLRDLYVKLTTSPQVCPQYQPWEDLPDLIRYAWIEVYRSASAIQPDVEEMVAWPWCEACQSYHHRKNPTCRLLQEKTNG